MKNITVSVDDDVYEQARMVAAARQSSVSAMVKAYLATVKASPAATAREEVARLQQQFAAMRVLREASPDALAGYNSEGTFE